MQIEDPRMMKKTKGFALLALGFRPFFLLAGFGSIVLMIIWLLLLAGPPLGSSYYPGKFWHSHEMLFGYVAAVVAGFLLTAVKNWTGMQTIRNMPLVLLSLLWLVGRILPFLLTQTDLQWLISIFDLAFLPAVALAIAFPITGKRQVTNYVFPILLLLMTVANVLTHLQFLGVTTATAVIGNQLMLYLVLIIIVIMGGRVIPFFTERGVQGVVTRSYAWCEQLSIASVVIVAVVDTFLRDSILLLPFALLAALCHAFRLFHWYDHRIWCVPMVWILQTGYAWLVVGLLMLALVPVGVVIREYAIHALTVGGMGLITLGMMARVALGHTGREILANRYIVLAFLLLEVAVIIRVFLPWFLPEHYLFSLNLSGGLWIAAFVVFVLHYTPILYATRIDGRPG